MDGDMTAVTASKRAAFAISLMLTSRGFTLSSSRLRLEYPLVLKFFILFWGPMGAFELDRRAKETKYSPKIRRLDLALENYVWRDGEPVIVRR
jgi:hypothetical protein